MVKTSLQVFRVWARGQAFWRSGACLGTRAGIQVLVSNEEFQLGVLIRGSNQAFQLRVPPIRGSNQEFQLGVLIRGSNQGFQLVRGSNQGFLLGVLIRGSNQVFQLGVLIRGSNQGFQLGSVHQTEFKKTFFPRISPEVPIGFLITKHILHFALLCLWNLIIHVKVWPIIWPYSSQPHQNKKWIIQFHTIGRAKLKKCFVNRRT